MTLPNDTAMVDQLFQVAGVKPSSGWLNEYRADPNIRQQSQQHSPDGMLSQILYHDLRDVVRELTPDGTNNANAVNPSAKQWRDALRAQTSAASNTTNLGTASIKTTLPSSFRLLVQVEEVVDVARKAESRLSADNAAGNRCLKLCLSDGYYDNGTAWQDQQQPSSPSSPLPLLAMEVTPIPNLTAAAPAGLKVLLHGPMDIRWGVMMWHEGNATVLGGQVPQMVELQTKAMELAKRAAGVGVDPTIRALIWNPETGDEQEDDEGEQESGDAPSRSGRSATQAPVPAPLQTRQPVITPAHSLQQLQQPQQHAFHNAYQSFTSTRDSSSTGLPLHSTPTVTSISSSGTAMPHRSSQVSANTTHVMSSSTTPPILATNTRALNDTSGGGAKPTNPYAKQKAGTARPNVTSTNTSSNDVGQNGATTIQQPTNSGSSAGNPLSTTTADVVMIDAEDCLDSEHLTPPPTENIPVHPNTPATANRGGISGSMATTISLPPPTNANAAIAVAPSPSAPQQQTRFMAFSDLRTLLDKMRTDEELYKRHFGTVFVTAMRQIGTKHHFNIDKVKRRKGNKKEKVYEYVMHCKFGEPTSTGQNIITCSVANTVMEPFFGYSAADMRQLSRSEKEKSAVLVQEGGNKMKETFSDVATWEATLLRPPDVFFRSTSDAVPPLDGESPVLLLLARRGV